MFYTSFKKKKKKKQICEMENTPDSVFSTCNEMFSSINLSLFT